jgi:hypothetical protein
MSDILTASDFAPHIGKTVTPAGQHRMLTLISVDTVKGAAWPGMTREPFILILSGPPGDVLPEGMYDAAIADGPTFGLYIMPIHTAARDRQDYQVVFN